MAWSPITVLFSSFFFGIVFEKIFLFKPWVVFWGLALVAVGMIVFFRKLRWFFALLICSFVLMGSIRASFVFYPSSDSLRFMENSRVVLVGRMHSALVAVSDNKYSFLLEVKQAGKIGEPLYRSRGQAKVLYRGDKPNLGIGDWVKIVGELSDFDELYNPAGFRVADYNYNLGIFKNLITSQNQVYLIKKGSRVSINNLVSCLQGQIKMRLQQILPGYHELLGSMLVGSSVAGLNRETQDRYKKAGLSHLLVASGMQIAILVGSVSALLSALKIELKYSFWLLTLLNLFCFLLTGAGTSIARACLMFQFVLFAKVAGRESGFLAALMLAALIICLFNPLALFSPSFLLSFFATVGVACLAPYLQNVWFINFPKWLGEQLAITLAPLILTYPICAYFFNQVSLVALLSNLIILPSISAFTIFSSVTLLLSFVWPTLAQIFGLAIYSYLFFLDRLVSGIANLPLATINLARFGLGGMAIIYLLIFLTLKIFEKRGRKIGLLICLLGLLVWGVWGISWGLFHPAPLEIVFMDVGQGDAILIRTPNQKTLLIDAGKKGMGQKVILPVLQSYGINQVDLMLITHAHADHAGGVQEVLRGIKVSRVARTLRFGDHFSCGEVNFFILGPPPATLTENNLNNRSIVMRVSYKNFACLLTGDAEQLEEKQIFEMYNNYFTGRSLTREKSWKYGLVSQVLKVGHHGSRTSSGIEFLKIIKPRYAVISCGRSNQFRHPHKSTLSNLAMVGAQVLRTDLNGAITIKTDGHKYWVFTAKPRKVSPKLTFLPKLL